MPQPIRLTPSLRFATVLVAGLSAFAPKVARAQTAPVPPPAFTPFGYVEALYSWNFNNPSNGITHMRGFDNRHNAFTLSNVALGVSWEHNNLIGRVALQVGHTPSTYYLAEPEAPGASGTSASGRGLWKYIQEANLGLRFGQSRRLTVRAGVFLSPIGPEAIPVQDNWNWSRSNLFFGLPFYHTGLRATWALTPAWSLTLAAYNGWNSVVDNNPAKSVSAQLNYTRDTLEVSVLYFGGVERATGAAEGTPWRHLLDAHVTWHPTPRLSLRAHANGGFERTRFGTSTWVAGAVYGRVRVAPRVWVALRGDYFREHAASSASGTASAIFGFAPWVASGTATVDWRPHPRISLRGEVRHDQAGSDLFFGGDVSGDGLTTPFVPNRRTQDTVTLGATTWF